MIILQVHIIAKNYENILVDQVHAMEQTSFPNSDRVFHEDKALFTQLTSSSICFLSTRMIYHISPSNHIHPTSMLPKHCDIHWRRMWVVVVHRYYLNLPLFFKKKCSVFRWQAYRKTVYWKTTSFWEC